VNQTRTPTLTQALITVLMMAVVIIGGIRLQPGLKGVFLPMTLAVGVVGALHFYLRKPWATLQENIIAGVSKVSIAVLILLLIGALVGVWIQGGIIPSLIYYGLKIISPSFFLPTTFLVCLIISLTTGTAFGTIGTVGVALMGVQAGLGIPAPVTAGAILCGAYFGDKMSPLSDTTNIAAAVGEADLFRHIRSMMYTTIPAALLTFFLFCIFGSNANSIGDNQLGRMLEGLNKGWNIHFIHFIPIVIMLLMALKKMSTLLLLFVHVLVGAIWSVIFQKSSLIQVFATATSGCKSETGIQNVGGSLKAAGVLEALVKGMLRWVKRTGSLVALVLVSCYIVILFTGNQALSLILVGQMFLPIFKTHRIDSTVMTRSLEDSGTLSAPLVPWGIAGGFCSQMLGIPTIEYLPFYWFAFLVPVFSLILGYTGIAVWKDEGQ
jgi:NhaC family Na+:H+ antiporter